MATSTRDQYRQQPEARNAENIRPQQTDSRREYDRFHPGHSPRARAVAPDLPEFNTGMPSSGFRDYNEDTRHSSPVRAPVHQMPLSNGMDHGLGRQSYGIRDHDLDQHKPYPRPQREHRAMPNPRIQSRPGSVSQTFPKRPASSSYPIAENESAPKRQRQMPAEASRPINNVTVHSSSGRPRQPEGIPAEHIHSQTGTKEALVTGQQSSSPLIACFCVLTKFHHSSKDCIRKCKYADEEYPDPVFQAGTTPGRGAYRSD